jgi:hypothetical protein
MEPAPKVTDSPDGAGSHPSEVTMTREEKDRRVDEVLAGYPDIGETIVSDDQTLYRLLQTLECSAADRDVGEYLCSFLTA